jgi:hypothetical protein
MTSNFVIWKYRALDGACVLQDLRGLDQTFRLNNGTSLQQGFPGDVSLHMNPDFPNDLLLTDNLLNSDMIIVASAKLKALIDSRQPAKVEYLPVRIIDHKERVASADYFIVHPVDPVECIDENQSEYKTKRNDPGSIRSISRLVLDETRIPADRSLFRLKRFWDITLVRRDLADAISAAGTTSVEWLELSGYPEE